MRRVFFHIHIWKTAGSSFLNICRNNFGRAFHRDIMLIQEWFLSTEQLRWLLMYHNWIRCYSCHMLSGDLPYDAEDAEVIGISFVRDPIDRFVSSYNYMMDDNYHGGYSKRIDFDELYTRTFVDVDNPWWRNGQAHIIGGNTAEEEALGKIRKNLENDRLILLVTERFDESCIVLERLFPDDFKDCSYIRYNVSAKKKNIAESQRKVVSKYMDLDTELLKLANNYLDAKLDRLYPDLDERQRYLKDFKKRCQTKRRRQSYIDTAKSFEHSIKKAALKIINYT
ncbi:MAG: sulfotransferase family 2 domain-containing protein [Actinobacteria bacterium]|nr:sulfotransferase family 2 domain-containing protein [Actinomycetota bacterium]